MRKLEIADVKVMQLAIRQGIDRSKESHYDHRLHGLLMIAASFRSCTEVGEYVRKTGRNGTTLGTQI